MVTLLQMYEADSRSIYNFYSFFELQSVQT